MKKIAILAFTALCLVLPAAGDVVMDDFQNTDGDGNRQTAIGAAIGKAKGGAVSAGGGMWHYWKDGFGSFVADKNGVVVTSSSGLDSLISPAGLEGSIHLIPLGPDTTYGWVNLAANFSGSEPNGRYFDFSSLTAIKIKGSGTGKIRINLGTRAARTWKWGNFGYTLTLPATPTDIVIPVDDIKPDPFSPAADSGLTFLADGANEVFSLIIAIPNAGDTAHFSIQEITFAGLSLETFTATSPVLGRAADAASASLFCPSRFSPGSSVGFQLPAPQSVALSVFDLGGNSISTIFSGVLPAGSHTIPWNAVDNAGRPAARGVYLLGLMTAGHQTTRVFTLTE